MILQEIIQQHHSIQIHNLKFLRASAILRKTMLGEQIFQTPKFRGSTEEKRRGKGGRRITTTTTSTARPWIAFPRRSRATRPSRRRRVCCQTEKHRTLSDFVKTNKRSQYLYIAKYVIYDKATFPSSDGYMTT